MSPARSSARPARAWQRMLSGRRLDLLDPSPLDVEIEDIAQGLSRVARWNGQTTGAWAFTVAQHSLLVDELARRLRPRLDRSGQLAALLHDAPEYVVGDLITPFKAAVGYDYRALERRLLAAIHIRFGLPPALEATLGGLIKRADRAAAYLEAVQLAAFTPEEADRIFGRATRFDDVALAPWPPAEAKVRFLDRFAELVENGGRP